MTTINNRKVPLSPRKYGASRAVRNVSPLSDKSEDPKQKGFLNRPRRGLGGKSFWDWMQFLVALAIPLAVAGASIWFSMQQANLADLQHQRDQQSALDQQEATILQTYLDNIQDLLLNHHLLASKPTDDVAILARARTLTALQGLDPERKGLLVKFIYEAKLIGFLGDDSKIHIAIINLNGANISNAKFNNTDHERGADYSEGMPSYIDLPFVNLEDTNLTGATLFRVDLSNADLNGAHDLTQQQLDQVSSCKGATLPKGLTCHHN